MVGGALLVFTVRRVGWVEVQRSITDIGVWYVLIVALGGVRFASRARAWQICAGRDALTFRPAFFAVLAGDALGNLTPLGMFASEPTKVFLVKDRVSTVAAVSSVAAENAFYMASVLIVLSAGALTFFSIADVPTTLRYGGQSVIGIFTMAVLAVIYAARRKPAVLSHLARTISAWTGRTATAPERLREIEVHFYALLKWPPARIAHVALWELAFHIAAVCEVFFVLQIVPVGRTATWTEAFVLETAGRLIVVVFKFIPYRLGVDEAGSAMIARALALDPAAGVTLALVRRVRVLFWNGIGLGLLATRR